MPFKNVERDVVAEVPTTVPLTVTVTQAKGIEATLAVTEKLVRRGYMVAPHLPARQFVDSSHVDGVIKRLCEAGVRSVFVIGGDAPSPAGNFSDSYSLLQTLESCGHPFEEVGIGGYPEGHAAIPQDAIDMALKQKAPIATRIVAQMCFDATATRAWVRGIQASGISLPVYVGMPGPVNRQKLLRISAGIGLGQSARFLQKQQSLMWRFLLPGGYSPTKLVKRLAAVERRTDSTISGLHIFTFNELAKTEAWRQRMLDVVSDLGNRS